MKPQEGYGLPPDVSVHGHLIDSLIHYTLVAIVIIFVVVFGAMVWTFVRHRAGHVAQYSHGSRASIGVLVTAIALIAIVVDGNLFGQTLHDMGTVFWNFAGVDGDPRTVRLEVSAHQWAWVARYPGPDGRFASADDIVTTNDIRVPVATPVLIQIASTDVIHSFSLVNFRVKQDAVPGMVNAITFEAREPGEYEIACAQHCGPNHYKMRGVLTVLSADDFAEWLAKATADARRAYDPEDKAAQWGWEWRSF
jgi:cytochrome c oxidase subunit II